MAYIIINALALWALSYECFRRLQGANYRPQRGYFKLLLSPYFIALIVVQATALAVYFCQLPQYLSTAAYCVAAVVFACIPHKSPLKFTKRIWRMLLVQLALTAVLSYFDVCHYAVVTLPFLALLSLAICLPLDNIIAKRYIKRATKKLEQSDVTVIAVTGSYGKTSVKDMLTALLDDAITPDGSCNTPLGIAAYINKTDLYYAKYLVLEFGARKRGDIAELCRLYRPKYGIVTGVCAQHLSTFKTLNNVIATKRELVESLPQKGVCVLNCKDEIAMSYADAGVCKKLASNDGFDLTVDNLTVDGAYLSVKRGKTTKQARLPQITAHACDTFAMCLAMCLSLKQSFTKTLKNVANVRQTPHRMEISKTQNCYIIDDSYNASIKGVTSAASTLSHFSQRKVVITQGLVECGKQRRELNVKCGRILGGACDVAITLGKNKRYLAEGLRQTNCKIIYAKNLKQAVALAQPYLSGEGSILLFQNDLPD